MASVIHEPLRFVTGPDAAERLALGTGRVELLGGMEKYIPDVTRSVLADIKFGMLPAAVGHEDKMAGLFQPGSKAWNDFFATRKIVERVVAGRTLVSVTSNIHERLTAEHHLGLEPEVVEQQIGLGRAKPRKYELAQVLTDMYLLDKFNFPERFLATVKNMAVALPEQAAAKLQEYVRAIPGNEKAVVQAGSYARSRKWAKASVKSIAAAYPILSVAADSVVVDQKLIVYGPSGKESWSVMGPLWYAAEVMDVYRMVCTAGTSSVMFALGTELVILDIDIHNGVEFESPTIDFHVGLHDALPEGSSVETSVMLSGNGRSKLLALDQGLELLEVDGQPVATAVRVTQKYVLVNAHVLDRGSVFRVSGRPAHQHRMLSKDLWLMRADSSESETVWSMRDAVVGEPVVVLYRRHGKVQFTSPMTVRSTDGVTMIMSLSLELQPGMSGGAILSLTDFALLGVYNGVGAQMAIASVFSQGQFTDVLTSDHTSDAGHDEAREVEGATYTRLRDRGLGRIVDAAINSMVPLYSNGTHVGMGVMRGEVLVTPCDVSSRELTIGFTDTHATFDSNNSGMYVATLPGLARAGPMLYRAPSYSERVMVLGIDRDGPYYSVVDARVVHVGVSARNFTIDSLDESGDLPYEGGLVVSVTDAAVLGVFVHNTVTEAFGQCGFCVALAAPKLQVPDQTDPIAVTLLRMYPMLHVNLWSEEVLEEIFSHSSVQSYLYSKQVFNKGMAPLAFIGDSAMRLVLGMRLRDAGMPVAKWQHYVQAHQKDSVLASYAERVGLHKLIKIGPGVSLPMGCKAHADVVESLAGAVYLNETLVVFQEFCDSAGLLPEMGGIT